MMIELERDVLLMTMVAAPKAPVLGVGVRTQGGLLGLCDSFLEAGVGRRQIGRWVHSAHRLTCSDEGVNQL